MKPSFETTTLIAAIGMIIYALYAVERYAMYEWCSVPYHFNLWKDIQERLMFDLLPLSLIIVGLGLYQQRPTNATRPFRILTICLFVALIGTLVFSPLYTYSIIGIGSISVSSFVSSDIGYLYGNIGFTDCVRNHFRHCLIEWKRICYWS